MYTSFEDAILGAASDDHAHVIELVANRVSDISHDSRKETHRLLRRASVASRQDDRRSAKHAAEIVRDAAGESRRIEARWDALEKLLQRKSYHLVNDGSGALHAAFELARKESEKWFTASLIAPAQVTPDTTGRFGQKKSA